MAGGSYFEVEARVVAPGITGKIAALLEPGARQIEARLQAALRNGLSGSADLKVKGARAGQEFADAFSRTMKARLEAAFRSLPKLQINANSSDVDREIADIRRKLEAANRAIDIGVDTKLVDARLDELRRRLATLARNSPDIKVRVNTGAALAELEALKRQLDSVDRKSPFRRWVADLRQARPEVDSIVRKLETLTQGASKAGSSVLSALPGSNPYATLAIVAAIVALLSTIGPIVAAATAGVFGLAGAIGVAALAFKGLKNEADSNTGVGGYIGREVDTIQRELSGLSKAAADAVGPGIRDLLTTVQRVLPTLKPIVSFIGGQLGHAVGDVGTALLMAFQKAEPLIADVAKYIEIGAARLRDWVASPTFERFLTYARQQLPILIGYVGDFGKAIIDTLVSLAPTGEGVLKVLDLVAKGISAVSKLGAFTGGASVLGALLGGDSDKKAADATTASIDALLESAKDIGRVSTDTALQVKAAASVTSQAWLDAANQFDADNATLTDRAGLLSAALTATRGDALAYATAMVGADSATRNLAKTISDNLSAVGKGGVLLGVSSVNDAGKFVEASGKYVEGSSAIVGALQQQVDAATQAAASTYQHEAAIKDTQTAAADALTVYKGYRQSLIDQSVQSGLTADKAKALADQYFAIPPDVDTFVKLLGQDNVTLAISGLTDALNRLSTIIAGPSATLRTTDFDNSLAISNSSLDYFGHQVTTPSLDLSTSAFDNQSGRVSTVLDLLNAKHASPSVTLNDQVSVKVQQVQRAIDGLHGKTLVIRTTYSPASTLGAVGLLPGGSTSGSAAGNIFDSIPQFAAGGFSMPNFAAGIEKHIPQIAAAGKFARIWAEPETGGEAYIPLANDWRRGRALDIWAATGERLGAFGGAPAASGPMLPNEVTLVDASGALLGRMQVVASSTVAASNKATAVSRRAGVASPVT